MLKEIDGQPVLTPEQVKVPERLEKRTLNHMLPGSWVYVDDGVVFYDDDRRVWLDGSAPTSDFMPLDDDEAEYVFVIRFDEGFVVNLYRSKRTLTGINRDVEADDLEPDPDYRNIEVIAVVITVDEDIALSAIYRTQFGKTIDEALTADSNRRAATRTPAQPISNSPTNTEPA